MKRADAARALGYVRVALGASLLVVPGAIDRIWVGGVARSRGAKMLGRAAGVRDVALGLGLVRALHQGLPTQSWLEAGALVDATDFLVTLLADPDLSPVGRWLVMPAAASGAATGLALRFSLGRGQ